MVQLEVENLKILREALCVAQNAIGQAHAFNQQKSYVTNKIDAIQKVIDQIDILRPLGPDGKHGDQHTDNCGCEVIWRPLPDFDGYEVSNKGNLRETGEFVWYRPESSPIDPDGDSWYTLYKNREAHLMAKSILLKLAFPEFKLQG